MATERGWHWTAAKDGKPVLRNGKPVVRGKWVTVQGELTMCRRGLHWSRKVCQALRYAPGAWLHEIEASRPVDEQSDKALSHRRRVLRSADMLQVLPEFARQCAVRARSAAAAAAAAAYAAADERKKVLAQCADIVRTHYPKGPV